MRGDQLARQWRLFRAIEASPKGLTVTEIAQREETGIRTVYRDLEALQAIGLPLCSDKAELVNRRILINTFISKFPPPFALTEFILLYFFQGPCASPERYPLFPSVRSFFQKARPVLTHQPLRYLEKINLVFDFAINRIRNNHWFKEVFALLNKATLEITPFLHTCDFSNRVGITNHDYPPVFSNRQMAAA